MQLNKFIKHAAMAMIAATWVSAADISIGAGMKSPKLKPLWASWRL
jgi:hypothetical protein